MINENRVEMEVIGGLCQIAFAPGVSCGGPDSSPGVSFDLVSDSPAFHRDGKYYHGMGVISRTDAARLRDMLEIFLKERAEKTND